MTDRSFQQDFVAAAPSAPVEAELARREDAIEEARRGLRAIDEEARRNSGRLQAGKIMDLVRKATAALDAVLGVDDPPSEKGKIVFALAPAAPPIPRTVIVGIPRSAWAHMAAGNTTHFDLTRAGVELQFMLFGCDSQEAGRQLLDAAFKAQGHPYIDARREDFSGAMGKMTPKPPAEGGTP